jgi:hypothetical protein
MTTIERQLAQYGRRQRELHGPITSDELTTRLDRPDDPARIGPDDVLAAAAGLAIASSERHPGENEPDEGDLLMVDIQTRESGTTRTDEMNRRRRARWVILAAAAVIVVIVAVALFDGTEENTQSDVVDAPSDVDAPEPTEEVVLAPGDVALAVSSDYIEASNSGDADAVLALLTPDVALSEKFTTSSFEAIDPAFFEQQLAWDTAQGTTFTSPECAVTDDSSSAEVTVVCEFGWLPAAEKAVDAPPVPTTLTMIVAPDGITQMAFEYPPAFSPGSFSDWLLAVHSADSQGVEYGDWNSVAEAEQGGKLRAQYVDEWVAWLEASDCTYLKTVFTVVPTGDDAEEPPELSC